MDSSSDECCVTSQAVKKAVDVIHEATKPGTELAGQIWATCVVNRARIPAEPDVEYVLEMFETFEACARAHFPALIDSLNAKAKATNTSEESGDG